MIEIIEQMSNTLITAVAVVVILLVWALKQTGVDTRWLPFISAGTGSVVGGCVAVFLFKADVSNGIYFGFVIGLAASGGYDALMSIIRRDGSNG